MTKINYGKRPGNKGPRIGTRPVAPTFGRTANPVSSSKFNDRRPFLVEGEAEQLVAQMLDFDPEVASFRAQGFTVDLIEGRLLYTPEQRKAARTRYRDLPGPCLYTPDFVLDLHGVRQRALEVKLDRFPGDDIYKEKLSLAQSIMQRHGCDFSLVVIPVDQRHALWTNVPLICQANMRKELWPAPDILRGVEEIAQQGALSARDYLRPLGLGSNTLPILIVSGALKVDIVAEHFKGDSKVEAAYGDISHLQLLGRLQA